MLHTHLRLVGTWQLYRHGERWNRSVMQLCAEIHTDSWVAACFGAPTVESYRRFDRSRHPGFGPLGPDLSRVDADIDEAINRLVHFERQQVPVAEALLDDHVAALLGNLVRCEALWATAIHPFAPVSSLSEDDCELLMRVAAEMRSGLRTWATNPAVYARSGQPCLRCGDPIVEARVSDQDARMLWWCPGCQVHRSPIAALQYDQDDSRAMDPHPAAVRFLSDLPWRRSRAG